MGNAHIEQDLWHHATPAHWNGRQISSCVQDKASAARLLHVFFARTFGFCSLLGSMEDEEMEWHLAAVAAKELSHGSQLTSSLGT